jgi:superfamily II DNA or RNA helicase
MTYRFHRTPELGFTELRLIGPSGDVAFGDWAIEAPPDLLPGVALARRLREADKAVDDGAVLHIEHEAVANLTAAEAARIGFPPLTEAVAAISTRGVMTRPDFAADLVWKRASGQAIAGAKRRGAWLRVGDEWQRLPDVLFSLAEAVDNLRRASGNDARARMQALAELRELLEPARMAGKAEATGLIGAMTIAVADAFSLDLKGDGEQSMLVPILHRAGRDGTLLPPDQQGAFGDQFNRFSGAHSLYALGGGTYVVLAPVLRQALAEVRRLQAEPLATKRAFLAAPRAFLREALGEETDATVLEALFRETPAYSDRVLGLGLWQRRVVPWIPLPSNDWFGADAGPGGRTGDAPPRPQRGIIVDGRPVPLSPEQAESLRRDIEDAIAGGRPAVELTVDGERIAIPATNGTLSALPKPVASPEVLLIGTNEEAIDLEAGWTPRKGGQPGIPACLRTGLKDHQATGLLWLQTAWAQGRPGVLLADDMGLGKTLQALAFLAWLREGMVTGTIQRAPVLIVAPTGLLENWRQEHDAHLAAPGLGVIMRAYGKDLAAHRAPDPAGRPRLSAAALRVADCVLTTYETLRDYDRDFGEVRFAAAVFDEAQKIKTPGIRLTDAAKAMHADFRLAMTGTPVENRLSDLWCIVDTVHPGYLGELKAFSTRYEQSPDEAALRALRDQLDRARGSRPPLLLRRFRADHLPDLPPFTEEVVEEVMPEAQREAYERAIAEARHTTGLGSTLSALAALRRISLHPSPDGVQADAAFIDESARLRVLFRVLDAVNDRQEKALVFLDDRDMQARLAVLVQRRYALVEPPAIINGTVPGAARQAHVNRFQAARAGFGVMVLSPRAGGVGLTLTSANHAIHLERWWNPAVEDQCTGRVLRIGQKRPVTIHVPQAVCAGRRSFDQNLHALLLRKRQLVREALGSGEVSEDEGRALLDASIA